MKPLKQVLGIDVSKKELVVTLARLNEDLSSDLYGRRSFANRQSGFIALHKWVRRHASAQIAVRYAMEPTGVYHQALAYYLTDQQEQVSLVLPNKLSSYMRTLDIKTVTDNTCADAIARFALERNLDRWKQPDPAYLAMKQLTREREQVVERRTSIKNQLHAEGSEAIPNLNSINRLNAVLALLNQQEKEIKAELEQLVKRNEAIREKVDKLTSVPGIGRLTAQIILAETSGFELIRNKKQLTSYAGLDVIEKQSGTSVKGKPRISKKGNRILRKAMHLPALTTIKEVESYKNLYERLVAKSGVKMKAIVAVQRKLLELTYILYKNDTVYDPEYEKKKGARSKMVSPL